MSASGNISPQSMSRMLRAPPPPCSMAMQLRPISPSPPRKMMRTGSAISAPSRSDVGSDADVLRPTCSGRSGNASRQRCRLASTLWRHLVDEGRRRTHRQPRLADGEPEMAHHRLGRDRVGRVVAGLEREALEHPAVDESGARRCRPSPTGRTCPDGRGPSSASPRRRCRRCRSPGAAASSRRRRCTPRSHRVPS